MHLHVGIIVNDENKMTILVDTGATMNTEYLGYHKRGMSQCPSMVAEYLECGAYTEYNLVHLLVALDLK